jgi:cytochrome d ubiquinol oxidase subunit I
VLRVGLTLAALLIPLQIVVGDLHGLNTLEHQPQKVAAMEGMWETAARRALAAVRDPRREASRSNRFEIAIPKLASFILTHDGTARSAA